MKTRVKETGRVLANLSRQAPNNSQRPRRCYEDIAFTCTDCGERCVWTAAQQCWWYEIVKGPLQSTAIRCRRCRTARRVERMQQRERSAAGLTRKTAAAPTAMSAKRS